VTSYVLDASVAAKWFLPPAQEPLAAEAQELLRGFSSGALRLLAPDRYSAFCANGALAGCAGPRETAPENQTAGPRLGRSRVHGLIEPCFCKRRLEVCATEAAQKRNQRSFPPVTPEFSGRLAAPAGVA
jgi:hypothetical protein